MVKKRLYEYYSCHVDIYNSLSNKYQHGSEFNINRYTYIFLIKNNPPNVKIPKNGT